MAEPEELQPEQPASEEQPVTEEAPAQLPEGTVDLDKEPESEEGRKAEAANPESRGARRVLRSELYETQAELRRLREELAEERGRRSAYERPQPSYYQQPPQQQQDPAQTHYQRLQQDQEGILLALQHAPQEKVGQLNARWHELERQKNEILIDARVRQAQSQQPQSNPQQAVENAILQSEFPEIMGDLANLTDAKAEMLRMMRNGRPANLATAREACKRVAAQLGIGRKPPAPTDIERARHTSTAGRATAGTGSGGRHFVPTKAQLASARGFTAHIPDISDSERVRIWRDKVGVPSGLAK